MNTDFEKIPKVDGRPVRIPFSVSICVNLWLAESAELCRVAPRGGLAAVARPICMEELAARLIQPFVSVGTEIVALCLE